MASVWIALERLLHQQRQAVEALAHVGVAGCQPYPRPSRQRDHRRRPPPASVAIAVVSVAASTTPLYRCDDLNRLAHVFTPMNSHVTHSLTSPARRPSPGGYAACEDELE